MAATLSLRDLLRKEGADPATLMGRHRYIYMRILVMENAQDAAARPGVRDLATRLGTQSAVSLTRHPAIIHCPTS